MRKKSQKHEKELQYAYPPPPTEKWKFSPRFRPNNKKGKITSGCPMEDPLSNSAVHPNANRGSCEKAEAIVGLRRGEKTDRKNQHTLTNINKQIPDKPPIVTNQT